MSEETVKMEVLNPRGVIESVKGVAPSPRISDIAGKKIALYSNSKPGMDNFYAVFEELLKEKYPTATTTKYTGAFLVRDEDADALAKEADAFVYGVGD